MIQFPVTFGKLAEPFNRTAGCRIPVGFFFILHTNLFYAFQTFIRPFRNVLFLPFYHNAVNTDIPSEHQIVTGKTHEKAHQFLITFLTGFPRLLFIRLFLHIDQNKVIKRRVNIQRMFLRFLINLLNR